MPSGDLSVPVSRCILPGRPEEYPALLTGFRLQVGVFFRPSTYLLEVQAGNPVVRVPESRIAIGDLLVMETDRDLWLTNRPVLVGKLVAVRLGGEHGVDFALARADMNPATRELKFASFGVQGPPAQASAAATPDASESSDTPHTAPRPEARGTGSFVTAPPRGRGVKLRHTRPSAVIPAKTDPVQPTPPTEPVPDIREEAQQALPSIEDVVGFCVLLIRT